MRFGDTPSMPPRTETSASAAAAHARAVGLLEASSPDEPVFFFPDVASALPDLPNVRSILFICALTSATSSPTQSLPQSSSLPAPLAPPFPPSSHPRFGAFASANAEANAGSNALGGGTMRVDAKHGSKSLRGTPASVPSPPSDPRPFTTWRSIERTPPSWLPAPDASRRRDARGAAFTTSSVGTVHPGSQPPPPPPS